MRELEYLIHQQLNHCTLDGDQRVALKYTPNPAGGVQGIPAAQEAEAGGLQVEGQPGRLSEILPQNEAHPEMRMETFSKGGALPEVPPQTGIHGAIDSSAALQCPLPCAGWSEGFTHGRAQPFIFGFHTTWWQIYLTSVAALTPVISPSRPWPIFPLKVAVRAAKLALQMLCITD